MNPGEDVNGQTSFGLDEDTHSLPMGIDPTRHFRTRKQTQDMTFSSRSRRSGRTLHTMTTPDDTAQTWRDVANKLTAAQIAQLERLERDEPKTLLEMARQWAAKNMIAAAPFGGVAPPAGSVRTFACQLDSNWFRDFEATRRGGPARVQIFGRQQADGSTWRWIAVHARHLGALDARRPANWRQR
jgi:hypothetical protein